MRRRISLLGSTGSIGTQALDVVRQLREEFEVVALAAGNNHELLLEQVREFRPRLVSVAAEASVPIVRSALAGSGIQVLSGAEGAAAAAQVDCELVLLAITGDAGIAPAFASLGPGRVLALANKEVVVAAGDLLREAARKQGTTILPVDSEHSAVFQCLVGESTREVRRVLLTASGGAFRDWPADQLADVTPEAALAHPTWKMGKKITIDSATLMNKGLEVIEAWRLFDVPIDRVDTVLHRQSILHALVEFQDGSVKAQMGPPDMRIPIHYSLTYPARPLWDAPLLDWQTLGTLTLEPLDLNRYPCLRLAYEAARQGGTAPAVLSAANEVAVDAFLQGRIRFTEIPAVVEQVLGRHRVSPTESLETVLAVSEWARRSASEYLAAQ
ncbi:MAG TPA: 1-deoxy-D-xylulose-5-phosphate reductoisomerase [Armatimonadota bacterium]